LDQRDTFRWGSGGRSEFPATNGAQHGFKGM